MVMVFSASPNRCTVKNQDVVGENYICIDTCEFALTDEDKMKAWGPSNNY